MAVVAWGTEGSEGEVEARGVGVATAGEWAAGVRGWEGVGWAALEAEA